MQRFPRRFWTWLIAGVSGLVFLAAVVSQAFQFAVQAVPGYRADVEKYVQQVTGRPVRIGSLDLVWRYYYPELELHDVSLMSEDGETALLSAESLRLGFSPVRLARREFTPNRLELAGLTLDLRLTRAGKLVVEGMEQ